MFTHIPIKADHIIGIKAEGVLTDADYKKFLPELEQSINNQGPVSAYVDMVDFEGWEAKAAWDDLKFGIAHDLDFDRIAVVGDSKWQQWMIKVSNIFFAADMRYFSAADQQQALDWLQEKQPENAAAEEEITISAYTHILLATDFSPHAELAALRAMEMAATYQAGLSIVHVLNNQILFDEFAEPAIIDQVSLYRELEVSSQQMLEKLAARLEVDDTVGVHLLTGNPGSEIVNFAAEQKVDLILVGSHGRHGLERVLGSVAAGLVRKADCDVLTVHL